MSDSSAQGTLVGICVLDCTHVLAGPFATVLLAVRYAALRPESVTVRGTA